jgi:hypothetical protein
MQIDFLVMHSAPVDRVDGAKAKSFSPPARFALLRTQRKSAVFIVFLRVLCGEIFHPESPT